VMGSSGAVLKEVGTTNKTKKNDYINAISEKTAIIMKSHPSQLQNSGFYRRSAIRGYSRYL